jgi:hypothetical protein
MLQLRCGVVAMSLSLAALVALRDFTSCNHVGAVSFHVSVWCSGLHYGEVFERVALQQERPPIPQEMPEVMRSLMVSCWADSPIVRPTFRMIQQALADMMARLPDSADRFVADL